MKKYLIKLSPSIMLLLLSCKEEQNKSILTGEGQGKYWNIVFELTVFNDSLKNAIGQENNYNSSIGMCELMSVSHPDLTIVQGDYSTFFNSSIYFDNERKIDYVNIYSHENPEIYDRKSIGKAQYGRVLAKSNIGLKESNSYNLNGDSLSMGNLGSYKIEYITNDIIILTKKRQNGNVIKLILSPSPVQKKIIIKDTSELKMIFPKKKWQFNDFTIQASREIKL